MTFEAVSSKLKEELIDIIKNKKEINDYELIVYKYLFINELNIPLHEELGVEISDDSFILYIIPDNLELALLEKLSHVFDEFRITFMPNPYNLIKLSFKLIKY